MSGLLHPWGQLEVFLGGWTDGQPVGWALKYSNWPELICMFSHRDTLLIYCPLVTGVAAGYND